jgi:heme exporter protein CcmD
MDFGKYADYMALGYAAMAVLLSGMIGWIYWRYRMLFQEQAQIDQLEAEDKK